MRTAGPVFLQTSYVVLGDVLPAHRMILCMTSDRVPNTDQRSLTVRPARRRPAYRARMLSGVLSLATMVTLGVGMATGTSSATTTHQSTRATAATTNAATSIAATSNAAPVWGATSGSASTPAAANTSSQAS